MQDLGRLGCSTQAELKDQRFGATRNSTLSAAERCEIRGDSKLKSPGQLKDVRCGATRSTSPDTPRDADAGQPAEAGAAHPEDPGAGATRSLIARLDGTMHDSMSCKGTDEKAPETPVSGALILRGIFAARTSPVPTP